MSTQSDQEVAGRQTWGAESGVKSADYGTRAVAYIIDWLIVWGLAIVAVFLFVGAGSTSDGFWVWLFLIPLALIWMVYLVWWVLLLRRGQTPGKLIMKLWVVRDGGQPAGWGLMFVREFFVKYLLFFFFGGFLILIATLLDLLWPIWDRNNQALHDKLVGTHVVQGARQEQTTLGPSGTDQSSAS